MALAGKRRGRRLALAVIAALAVLLGVATAAPGVADAAGTVTVTVAGQGSATGPGINCTHTGGPDCSEFYSNVQECDEDVPPNCFFVAPTVTLSAGADSNGFVFDDWTGCDVETDRDCEVTVSGDTPLTAHFRDAQAPTVGTVTPSGGAQRGTISLGASASDNGTINRVEFRVRGVLVGSDTSAPYGASYNTAVVTDGAATIQATAFDAAGNAGSAQSSVTIDNTAPGASITSGPDGAILTGGTQTWNFTASDSTSGLESIRCSVVASGSPHSFGLCSGISSHSVSGLADGAYTFALRVRDAAGNETILTRTFTIDGTPPTLNITSGPNGAAIGTGAASWAFSASDATSGVASVACSLVAQGSAPAFGACSGATSHSVSGLSDGSYTFSVRATDGAGNVVTQTRSFSVDTAQPELSISSGPNGDVLPGGASQSWAFSATDAASGVASVACSVVSAGSPAVFGACSGGNSSHSVSGLPDGGYTFTVRVRDNANNERTATRSFTIDGTPPGLGITSGPDGQTFGTGTTQTWAFAATDPHLQAVECGVGGTGSTPAFAPCSGGGTGHSVSGLAPGSYVFTLRARDSAGNTTTLTRSFSVVQGTGPSDGGTGGDGNTGGTGGEGGAGGDGGNTGGDGGNTITDAQILLALTTDLTAAARTLGKQRLGKLARKGSVALPFNALVAGRIALAFKGAATKQMAARSVTIAKGSRTVTAAGAYNVTLKLTKAGKRLLRGGRRVKGKLSASFTRTGGSPLSIARGVTLKRR